MEPDFSGYATRHNIKCSDGRIIAPQAFKHHNQTKVPLVWSHQHGEPTNVLGHALLESRDDGVYAYGFFNESESTAHAKQLVAHGDITALSIYANKLVQKDSTVLHGNIREVSLVLSGANPGAFIDQVNIAHGDDELASSEAIIYSGETLMHFDQKEELDVNTLTHEDDEKTVADVFDTLTDEQKNVVYYMIGTALENEGMQQSDDSDYITHQEVDEMLHNVFESDQDLSHAELSHDELASIITDAKKMGSLKEAFLAHAGDYGIDDIDILFPDAKTVTPTPEVIGRRMEWVPAVLNGTTHTPFSRIKSTAVDITADEARAKGYVKGNRKKDEVIKLLKRVTTPTTIYKKQKLDRDDVVDITDLDVIAWLKAEMRVMLDEEIARAVLIGDGRESDDEDKIDEEKIRPISKDDEMYSHKVELPANVFGDALVEAVVRARTYYKGSGTPTFFTTDKVITDLLLIKDRMGRRLYPTETELAAALRVTRLVPVEVMETEPNLLGIMVNLSDYKLGADKGGQVSMFDDFDIDYNQMKYLIETRLSGALYKPKSALVFTRSGGTVVTPQTPTFDTATDTITIPTQDGVIFSINGSPVTGNVTIGEITEVEAAPAPGFSFPPNIDVDWVFDPAA